MLTKNRFFIFLQAICLVFFLSSCLDKSEDSDAPSPANKKIFFSAMYTNFGYSTGQVGYFIDEDRRLFWFSKTSATMVDLGRQYQRNELSAWFPDNASYMKQLTVAEFDAMKADAVESVTGILDGPNQICNDAGTYDYLYFHIQGDGSYQPVLIYRTGDWRTVNTAAAAEDLREKLIDFALEYQIAKRLNGGDNWCTGL